MILHLIYEYWLYFLILYTVSVSGFSPPPTSSRVLGSLLPLVSGRPRLRRPPLRPRMAKMVNWNPGKVSPTMTMNGERMEPTLAMADTIPMEEVLMLVGNISPDII